jgi:mono/diheme cytochrome c family protein
MRITLLASLLCVAQPAASHAQALQHGKYIVEQIGMCADCHTPRDDQGNLVAPESLHGAPIGFRPLHPMPFAEQAPRIAGLPANWTPQQTATFLSTGKRPDGTFARPPMPAYRLSTEDAWAVVTYLKSLK